MRKYHLDFLTFCWLFANCICIHAQCVEPDNLTYKRNAYYLNGMKVPYTGCVEGYVHNPLHSLGGGRFANCMIGTYELSTGDTTVSFGHEYVAYVKGQLNNGKEVGTWELYGSENQLIGICDFFVNKKYIMLTIYAHDYPICRGLMYYNWNVSFGATTTWNATTPLFLNN